MVFLFSFLIFSNLVFSVFVSSGRLKGLTRLIFAGLAPYADTRCLRRVKGAFEETFILRFSENNTKFSSLDEESRSRGWRIPRSEAEARVLHLQPWSGKCTLRGANRKNALVRRWPDFLFNASVNDSASVMLLTLTYAPWLPSNDGQERTDPSVLGRLGNVVIGRSRLSAVVRSCQHLYALQDLL